MKSIYNIIILSLIIATSANALDKAKEEFKKSIKKEFDISRSGEVILSNKYGNIDIRTNGNTDKVVIEVEIIVNARNEDVANDAFERINIDFESSSGMVKAETVLDSQKGNWWSGNSKSYDFKINYDVSIPSSVELDVSNKYGNVYAMAVDNDIDLEIKYGNFKLEGGQEVTVECKYGMGEIGTCNNLNADLGYVSGEGFQVEKCSNAEIDSKYSKIKIKNAKTINADAGYDNYDIGYTEVFKLDGNYNKINIDDVVDFSTDTKYTNINIEELRGSADIDMGYGGLDIYKVHAGFKSIIVDSKYAAVKMRIASDATYEVNLDADYAGIEYPENLDVRISDKDNNSKHVEGRVGSNPSGTIKVTSDYGSIKIR